MVYLLDSKSFTGKTTYLKNLVKNNTDKTNKYFTDEEWTKFIIESFQKSDSRVLDHFDIVCIDNIDFLKNSPTIQEVTAEIVTELKDKTDFYLSGIELGERISTIITLLKINQIGIKYIDVTERNN